MTSLAYSILTTSTCGDNCWHAREAVCRCSCNGRNHGILTQGGTQPVRNGKIDGNPYDLVAVIPGRASGECWIDVSRRIEAEKTQVINERFPGLDPYAYGNWREEKTMPVVDRKISASQEKWAEVQAVPNACRLIWARPAGTPYYVRGENFKARLVTP